jgi:PAS domain S-box-containing protein
MTEPGWSTFQDLIEHLPVAVFMLTDDANPAMRYVSPQVERLTGYPAASWMRDPSLRLRSLHRDDRERVQDLWELSIRLRSTFQAEYRVVRPDGGTVWVRQITDPVQREDGSISHWHGVAVDITDRRVTEGALARSEARYRALVERVPAVIYIDTDEVPPRSVYVSPNAEGILGHLPAAYLADDGLWGRSVHRQDRPALERAWAEAVRRRTPFDEEYRVVRPDGSTIWARDRSIPIADDDGTTMFWQGVVLDITARKEAEEELRRSETRYRVLVEQVPAVVYEMGRDDERRTLYVSPHVEAILGYSREEWLAQPDIWIELLHPDDREIELAAHDRHAETGEPWSREYRLIAADGRVVWVRDQAVLVRDPDGDRWQGVMLDVTVKKDAEEVLRLTNDDLELRVLARTAELEDANEMMSLEIGERRRVEQELREAEERYRLLVEALPAAVYVWELSWEDQPESEYRLQPYMSPQIEGILGFSPDEFRQTGLWRERIHPHDRDRVESLLARCKRTGEPFNAEYRSLAKDGHIVWVLDRATLLRRDQEGEPQRYQGIILDITPRKDAEAKEAGAEGRFRALTEEGPVVTYVYVVDHDPAPPSPRVEYVSPQVAGLVGYPVRRWADDPRRWLEMVHPDDRERVSASVERLYRMGGSWSDEYRMIAGDGRIIWIHDEGRMVSRDTLGRPLRFHGALLDVTDEREARVRLARSERRYRELVEGAPAVAWIERFDRRTERSRFTYIGPQAEEIFGYTADELLAEPDHFERMLHPDDRERVLARVRNVDETLEAWEDEFRVIARDGSERTIHAAARAVPPEPGDDVVTWHGMSMEISSGARAASDIAARESERITPSG